MTRLERWSLGVILIASCGACAHRTHTIGSLNPAPYRIPGFSFTPPPTYVGWIAAAHNCAFQLHAIMGDTAGFTVDNVPVDISRITWITVPTEREDGRFLSGFTPKGDSVYVSGLTSEHVDTIWLSANGVDNERLVKHEAMHVFVQSPGELNYGPHGLPWGLCEFL